jgi:mRNA interferase MazF
VEQGDVYFYTFRAPDNRRPVLILTRDSAIPFLNAVTIAPITTTIREVPSYVVLTPYDGMPEECAVNLDRIQTVPKEQLGAFVTHLSPPRMQDVAAAIEFALGLDALRDEF